VIQAMKAVVVRTFGPPETFALEELAPREPGPGEVRILVHSAGVSYVDALVAEGKYQMKPPLPFTPGSEFAGVVETIGDGVASLNVGDRVFGPSFGAVFAEQATVPAAAVSVMPATRSFDEAAVFRVSYATAHHALVQRAGLRAGETVLVLGAGGAVGYACVQVAKVLGARVIASASTAEKRALARSAGADEVLDTGSGEWRAAVKNATGGRGVDVVVDPVGGEATERAFRSLAWRGRHLVIGFTAGAIPALPTNLALLKGAALVGVDLRQFSALEPEVAAENDRVLLQLFAEGTLKPAIAMTYPLERFAEALREAASGRTAGRVVLRIR
jgi:NADPH:quinone reductase